MSLIHCYASLADVHDREGDVDRYTEDGVMTRPTAPGAPVIGRRSYGEFGSDATWKKLRRPQEAVAA